MKKKKIGIPRAFLYYRNGVLWKNFFKSLGCKVIISPETNNEILSLGIKNTINCSCLAYKIYIGHALFLVDKSDYIIIPKVCNYGNNDKVCQLFTKTYEKIKHIVPKEKLLSYNIEHTKYRYELIGLIKLGLKFNKNPIKVIYSLIRAKQKQKQYNLQKQNENKNNLLKQKIKILIMSQFYNIEDKFISCHIKEYLSRNNIATILSSNLDIMIAKTFSEYFSNTFSLKYSKEMIGALYYYKYQVDGIILLSANQCKIDSLINNLIIKQNTKIPILSITIDENITYLNLEKKLEKFINYIKDEYNE